MAQNGPQEPVPGPSFIDVPSKLFENALSVMGWAGASTPARGLTWSTGVALQPILPPTSAFSEVSRADALKCPPVGRGVGLYVSALLRQKWVASEATMTWLGRSTGPVPAKLRDTRTLVDVILDNRSMWVLSRDSEGKPYEAAHIPVGAWSRNEFGQYVVNGTVVPPALEADLVIFEGAMALPFLEAAKDTLIHYRDITATIKDRSANPMALQEIKLLEDYDGARPGDPDYEEAYDEALNTQKSYAAARGKSGGTVTVTPRNMELKIHQANDDGGMLINARMAVRGDVANHLNIPVAMLDGESGSNDYSNTLQNVNEFSALSLGLFTEPLTLKLSQVAEEAVTLTELDIQTESAAKGNVGSAVGTIQNPNAGVQLGPDTETP
jgi:hypothetical protein